MENQFRLHIDLPLGTSEQDAINAAKAVIEKLNAQDVLKVVNTLCAPDEVKLQYRLGNDGDRRIKNYLVKNDNNHVSEKKTVVKLDSAV